MMTEYQDKLNARASQYALETALAVPFISLPLMDIINRFKDELRLAYLAGAEHGTNKDFLDTRKDPHG